jgi:hypothetical protein
VSCAAGFDGGSFLKSVAALCRDSADCD